MDSHTRDDPLDPVIDTSRVFIVSFTRCICGPLHCFARAYNISNIIFNEKYIDT